MIDPPTRTDSIDKILRSISHDFKEPLRSIRWYLNRILDDLTIDQDRRTRKLVQKLDADLDSAQTRFQHLYKSYLQNAGVLRFQRFVEGRLRKSIDSVLEQWPGLLPKVRHIEFDDAELSIEDLDATITRLGRRYEGLLEYLALEGRSQLIRTNLEVELHRVTNDIIYLLSLNNVSPNAIRVYGSVTGRFDRILMSVLFQNLIVNSVKYRDATRKLRVEIKMGTCGARELSLYIPRELQQEFVGRGNFSEVVLICYKDNARGIPRQYWQSVFEPYVQVQSNRPSAENSGSGMGLAIVRTAVERHRGVVWLTSKLGVGTKFFVALPNVEGLAQAGEDGSAPFGDLDAWLAPLE